MHTRNTASVESSNTRKNKNKNKRQNFSCDQKAPTWILDVGQRRWESFACQNRGLFWYFVIFMVIFNFPQNPLKELISSTVEKKTKTIYAQKAAQSSKKLEIWRASFRAEEALPKHAIKNFITFKGTNLKWQHSQLYVREPSSPSGHYTTVWGIANNRRRQTTLQNKREDIIIGWLHSWLCWAFFFMLLF